MADEKKPPADSNSPSPDLKSERDRFVKTFTGGSRLTDATPSS